MKHEEILRKAIEKAEKKGFDFDKSWLDTFEASTLYSIIYNHDFAKSFWGEEETSPFAKFNSDKQYAPAWMCHLQQMVLEKSPLKYLEKHL